ncbi:MAG: LIC12162 family protein [Ilumatobacteraceae bacterium]
MSRYLITTEDESTWKFDRPVIFLGRWCLNEDRREVWQSLDYSIVDPQSIARVLPDLYQQTQILYSQLSDDLATALNAFHGRDFSHRYWMVIAGPWLRSFCDNFIFRWAYMNQAVNEFNANESYSDFDDADPSNHPRNYHEYRASQLNREWNQYMYSKMWSLMSSPELPSPPLSPQRDLGVPRVDPVERENSFSNRQAILTDTYLPRASEATLSVLMRNRPSKGRRIAAPQRDFDPLSRTQLRFPSAPTSRLHAIGREMVRDQILTSYVEGFPELIDSVDLLQLPIAPKLVFTSNRHLYDDVFNAWVAQATELGSTYVIGQHGGHYGLSRFPSFSELHEEDISDGYLTWGRKDSTKQIPGLCLTTVGRKYRHSPKAKYLTIVCDDIWKYPRSLFFDILENSGYLEYVAQCVTGLPVTIAKDVLVRTKHAHTGTGGSQFDWWRRHVPEVELDDGLSRMKNLLRRSRLVVSTSNGSTLLETLNLNIPTLITWDESFVQLRQEALPYFQNLEEVGIFHRSPQSFVDHLSKNWTDVESWWSGKDVQAARKSFCDQYSKKESHPLLYLRKVLRSALRAKGQSQ